MNYVTFLIESNIKEKEKLGNRSLLTYCSSTLNPRKLGEMSGILHAQCFELLVSELVV